MTVEDLQQIGHGSPDGALLMGNHFPVNASTGAIQTLLPEQSGSVMLLDRAILEYILPSVPIPGMNYAFMSTIAGTAQEVNASGTGGSIFLLGSIQQTVDTAATGEGHFANGTTHVGLTMNGTTKGGLIGSTFTVVCLTATIWNIQGLLQSSGSFATPFTT